MRMIVSLLCLLFCAQAPAQEAKKERLKDFEIVVVSNREDGLIVRKIVPRMERGKAVEMVQSSAMFFVPHTAETKEIPDASVFKIKGIQKGTKRVSPDALLAVIEFRLFESRPAIPEEEK